MFEQWIDEFEKLAFDVFDLYIYHDDIVDVHSLSHECRRVFEILYDRNFRKDSMHDFFDITNENNVNVVIFITSQILTTRHDSIELKKWRTNQFIDDANRHEYDDIWERNLARKFDIVIIDEIHIMKDIFFDIIVTIKWLMIAFLILMIDTSLFNDISNLKDFMTLFEHSNAKKWWNRREFARVNIIENFNLWYLFDDHEETKLRLTNYVVKEFLLNNSMIFIQKEQYLEKIYEKCFLRRIHASIMKEIEDKIIEKILSKMKIAFLNCKLTKTKNLNYRVAMKKHLSYIINFDNMNIRKKAFKINLRIFRKMNMMSFWSSLMKLKKKDMNLKIINQKKFIDDDNLANKWFSILSSNKSLNNIERIMIICIDAFDIKVLLKNFKFQVNFHFHLQRTSLK